MSTLYTTNMLPPVTLTIASLASMLSLHLSVAAQTINKPFIWSNVQADFFESDLKNELAAHTQSSTAWAAGWIPQYCYNEAKTFGLNPSDFEVRNVFYTDCDASWAVCRHKSAGSTSWDTIIDKLGRIPVGARQFISNVAVLPSSVPNLCARTFYSPWLASTYSEGCYHLGVIAHETTHILDDAALTSVDEGGLYSQTTHWSGALNKDSYVPTDYARTNTAEAFAEAGRFGLSDLVHPEGLAAYTSLRGNIANQLGNYEGRLTDVIFPSGGRCTGKVDTSQAVQMSNGSSAQRLNVNLFSSVVGTDVPVIEKKPARDNITHSENYAGEH